MKFAITAPSPVICTRWRSWCANLATRGKELRVCYEAGPCGFVIARRLRQLKIDCAVVAPSLTPKGKGDKIKTDRRDARMLARLHRAGELTAVHIPDAHDEAIRDVCRARTDAVGDQRRARHQLKFFLLRNGYRYSESTAWSEAHMRYSARAGAAPAGHEDRAGGVSAGHRRRATNASRAWRPHMAALLEDWAQAPVVRALMGLRGFQLVAAMIIVSELGDIHRFEHPASSWPISAWCPAKTAAAPRAG